MKVSQNKLNIHKRFYTALALQDLVNEVPLSEVAKKFQCARGFLQGLQQAAATFAGLLFQDRLHFGIHSELIELMKLSSLNGIRARALFDGGLETISDVASADVNIIENILLKAVPFQSEKEREVDDEDDIRKRNKIKNIWITGNCGMTANEAAKNLIYEARKFLQLEIGVTEIKWKELKVAKASDDVLDSVKENLGRWLGKESLSLKMLSLKASYPYFKSCFDSHPASRCADLLLSEWLIQSDEKTYDIYHLMKKYCDIDLCAAPIKIGNMVTELKKIDSVEIMLLKAWCVWSVAEKQQRHLLQQYQDINDVVRVETHVSRILADCESNGLLVDRQLASQLLIDVRNSQEILQKKAYKLCGYHFNFNSPKDVAKVLGMYKGRKVSTKKSVLTAHNSPMASVVIYWRKLNAILTKTLYPLTERASVYNTDNRINPSYTMQTGTGRITMREPNLQNVPRTFSVPVKYLTLTSENDLCADTIEFNCRDAFKAAPGCVFVSADYCQLEMRILTHYSGDPVLTDIMRSDVDVFKAIAASWSCVSEEEVDDDLRQKAKQLCYGILYGMGNRTLSQHLDVTEAEAAVFMDSFYKTYPAVKVFTHSIVDTCRRQGYVETLRKRRRYLPDINSTLAFKRCAAERQAVNTTIQGSAADIAKAAMCAVDDATRIERFKPRLVLQMHDELIYEVDESYCREFAKVLKRLMEETVRLDVPLPVKVKSGPSWGCLNEIAVV
ncbi:unnamed protein product, partial [Iphiclides podalirius]